jgi:hypothetical protein
VQRTNELDAGAVGAFHAPYVLGAIICCKGGKMQPSRDTTARLAKDLWSLEARELPPAEFQTRFDAVYAAAEGPATLWHLGGAANDYLRAHPEAIAVPAELAHALLASEIVDGRIIGLKLLNRCSSDLHAICSAICDALESKHEHTLYGGLCELDNLLRRLSPMSSTATLPVNDILPRLRRLYSSSDPYVRQSAERLQDSLKEFGGARGRELVPGADPEAK